MSNAELDCLELKLGSFEQQNLSPSLMRELRSDHAGETGAVWIYRGILKVTNDTEVRSFAREHLRTENRHLAFFERWLPGHCHSVLLPLWRVAGFMLGAFCALFGARFTFVTIAAVEDFVVAHYQQQIDTLQIQYGAQTPLAQLLSYFQADEHHHQSDANRRTHGSMKTGEKLWFKLVGGGSRSAVIAAKLC